MGIIENGDSTDGAFLPFKVILIIGGRLVAVSIPFAIKNTFS